MSAAEITHQCSPCGNGSPTSTQRVAKWRERKQPAASGRVIPPVPDPLPEGLSTRALIRAYATNVLATYPERAFEEDVVVRPFYGRLVRDAAATREGRPRLHAIRGKPGMRLGKGSHGRSGEGGQAFGAKAGAVA